MLRTGNKGFTLLEVMVATAILALGTLLIYESFFVSLDLFDYCSNYFAVASWMDETIWKAQDSLSHFGSLAEIETNGEFANRNKNFYWNLSYDIIDTTQLLYKADLYKIDLVLFWQNGPKRRQLLRTAYAIYEEK
jgi:prepilin-type N-terminal cleavage/methylation domain-containing protein